MKNPSKNHLVAGLLMLGLCAAGCGSKKSSSRSAAAAVASGQTATSASSNGAVSSSGLGTIAYGGAQAPGPSSVTVPNGAPGAGFPALNPAPAPGATVPAPATPAPTTPAPASPATVPVPATATVIPDSDNDGLNDQQEQLLGTDVNDPDSDGDGIDDGRDLAPLYGADDYGPFGETYPAGAVQSERSFRAVGLSGRSEIQSRGLLNWKQVYTGTQGTRSSVIDARTVAANLSQRFADTEFVAIDAQSQGSKRRLDTYEYRKQVFTKRYHIDYDLQGQDYAVTFRNKTATTLKDRRNRAFASRSFKVTVHGGLLSTLVMQLALDPGADRTRAGQNDYTLPAFSYQVFAGTELLKSQLVLDEVAIGSLLNRYAYEMRMPLVAPQGSGKQEWTVVVTPLWVSRTGNDPITVDAMPARSIRMGAAAHDLRLVSGTNTVARVLGIYRGMQGFTSDLRAAALGQSYDKVKTNERRVISRNERKEWVLSTLAVTASISRATNATLVYVDERSKSVKGKHLTDLMDARSARRYHAITQHLLTASYSASAVIDGLNAIVAIREGDRVRAITYTARTAADVYLLADSVGLVRASSGAVAGLSAATHGLDAFQAFRDGDKALGVVHLARGAGSIANLFFSGTSVKGIPAGSLITVAVGVIDVGFHVYKASKATDPILKQAHVEMAAAAAVDVGITVIPTVGPVVQVVWRSAWTVVTFVSPDLSRQRMYATPGTYVTYVGQVIFTTSIPSAIAEMAYEEAAEQVLARVKDLEAQGTAATAILPEASAAQATPAPFAEAATQSTSKSSQTFQQQKYAQGEALRKKVTSAPKKAANKVASGTKSVLKKIGDGLKKLLPKKKSSKPSAKKASAKAKAKSNKKPGFFSKVKNVFSKKKSAKPAAKKKASSKKPGVLSKLFGKKTSNKQATNDGAKRSVETPQAKAPSKPSLWERTKSFFGNLFGKKKP